MLDFPKCQAYVASMKIRHTPDMLPKHYAWLLGDAAFSDKELREMGAAGLPMARWGTLLPKMEARLGIRQKRPTKREMPREQWNRLIGMMACYGLKGSALASDSAVLEVARILWKGEIRRQDSTPAAILVRLEWMQKKRRSAVARSNLPRIPAHYFAVSKG